MDSQEIALLVGAAQGDDRREIGIVITIRIEVVKSGTISGIAIVSYRIRFTIIDRVDQIEIAAYINCQPKVGVGIKIIVDLIPTAVDQQGVDAAY